MAGKKVVVGMSGGVDSSVAAFLLKEQGYDVIGVTMQIWQDEDEFTQERNGGCCGLSAVEDARRVAERLEIPYYVMNFKREFKADVMDYFVAEYLKGRTPNPCIACNRYVKWEALLQRSLEIGADYIATGHYARIEKLPNGRYAIKNSVSVTGEILGQHKGITHYTVGQRKGLGIALGHPVFVTEIRPETNEVVLGENEDVYTNRLYADHLNFMSLPDIREEVVLKAKIRYSHSGSLCRVKRTGEDEICCEFLEPVRAVTPGQAVVLYDGDYVAGGGIIVR